MRKRDFDSKFISNLLIINLLLGLEGVGVISQLAGLSNHEIKVMLCAMGCCLIAKHELIECISSTFVVAKAICGDQLQMMNTGLDQF